MCIYNYLFQFLKEKQRHLLLLALIWIINTAWCLTQALSILFLSKSLFILAVYLYIPLGFGLVLIFDAISRESVDPLKILLVTALSTAVIFTSFDPNAVVPFIANNPNKLDNFKSTSVLISEFFSFVPEYD